MQRRNHNFNVVLILISYLILKILEFVFKKSKEKWTKLWTFRLSTSDELDVPTFGDKPVMEIAKQHGGYQLQRVRVEDYNLLCFMEEDEGLFLQPHLAHFI
ncbi:hypothetical protein C5167_040661 [Papaver somniferum]|uniref:Uncharacterized protein n=1 Tax=Papaver somniferum TaxID=3469 RepID=A0A4Y7IJT7_PAPSO|nr:hypothetical protein C5167_040661 [Papaver somniferum]